MKMRGSILSSVCSFFHKRSVVKDSCKTKYPILLIHGIALRDDMLLASWGSIPDYLRRGGADLYLANTEAWASYKINAEIIRDKISDILEESKSDKVNIIAHSKGGIDARYAISFYKLDDQVASLTTISTPHRGTCIADIVTKKIPTETSFLYDAVNLIGEIMGDEQADANQAIKELTQNAMKLFNEKHPDSKNIYYQSYGARMSGPIDDPLFSASNLIVKKHEGENDGMISVSSYQWGEFQGIIGSKFPGFGISHGQISGIVPNIITCKNVPQLYVKWVSRLKEKDY